MVKKGNPAPTVPPEHQPDAVLTQANPVQNTWYTLLSTTINVRLYAITVMVETTGETLEVRLTIDGNVHVASIAAAANTYYYVFYRPSDGTLQLEPTGSLFHVNAVLGAKALESRSIKVEVRKTTAAGSGTLNGRAVYGRW